MSATAGRRIAGASAVLAAGILVGRLAGLLREMTLAAVLGAGSEADVAVLVLTLPDVLTAFLLGGAVTAVLVPEFTRRLAAGTGARATLRDAELAVALGGLAIAGAVAALASPLAGLLGPGLAPDAREAAAGLLALSALAVPLAGLSAVAGAYLQAHGRFVATAAGTVVVNLVLVAGLALAVRPGALGPLAAAIVIAGAARWLVQRAEVFRVAGDRGRSTLWRDVRRLAGAYAAAIGGTSALVLLPFLMRAFASLGAPGDVAVVNYALRILELPLGAFITVGSIAALPFLAALVARGEDEGALGLLRQLVLATQILTVPLALGGTLAAGALAALLYGRPAVGAATGDIASLAALGMASLPAQGLAAVAQAYLIARGRLGLLLAVNGTALLAYAALGAPLVAALGTHGVVVGYVALHIAVAAALVSASGLLRPPRAGALLRDAGLALGISLAVFATVALAGTLAPPSAPWTLAVAAVAAAAAIGAAAVAPYRSLPPGGLRRVLLARQ